MDQDIGSDDFEGKVDVSIEPLRDQLKHESWHDLQGDGNERWQGKIRLEMHWVWSTQHYLQDCLMKWDEILQENQEQKNLYIRHLSDLKSPFGWMDHGDESETDEENDDKTHAEPATGTVQHKVFKAKQMAS